MDLTLVVTKNCNGCKRAEEKLKQFTSDKENLNLIITDVNDFNKPGIAIVPALFIDDELFSYGEIEKEKLLFKLESIKSMKP